MQATKQNPLEFWGQTLLNAAAWQRQMEWLMRLTPTANQLTGASGNVEAKETVLQEGSPTSRSVWADTMSASNDLYENWLQLCGWVPRKQYDDLQARFTALEKRYAQQKEMIDRMRQANGWNPQAFFDGFNHFFTRQSGEFKRLIENLRESAAVEPAEQKAEEYGPEADK
jgi:hypothetical protein